MSLPIDVNMVKCELPTEIKAEDISRLFQADTVNNMTASRETLVTLSAENSKLLSRLQECEKDLLNLRLQYRDVTKAYSDLSDKHDEYMQIRLDLRSKLEKERNAHTATKIKVLELKAEITELDQENANLMVASCRSLASTA